MQIPLPQIVLMVRTGNARLTVAALKSCAVSVPFLPNFTPAAHPKGKSVYGISDTVGNIWQVNHARAFQPLLRYRV